MGDKIDCCRCEYMGRQACETGWDVRERAGREYVVLWDWSGGIDAMFDAGESGRGLAMK